MTDKRPILLLKYKNILYKSDILGQTEPKQTKCFNLKTTDFVVYASNVTNKLMKTYMLCHTATTQRCILCI